MLRSGRGWISCRIGIELIRAKGMTVQQVTAWCLGLLNCRAGTTFGVDGEALARMCVTNECYDMGFAWFDVPFWMGWDEKTVKVCLILVRYPSMRPS